MLGTGGPQGPHGHGILALTVAEGLRDHRTDGETEGQLSRMTWQNYPPTLLMLWAGQVSIHLFYAQSAYFHGTCNPRPTTTMCVTKKQAESKGSSCGGRGETRMPSDTYPSYLVNAPCLSLESTTLQST